MPLSGGKELMHMRDFRQSLTNNRCFRKWSWMKGNRNPGNEIRREGRNKMLKI